MGSLLISLYLHSIRESLPLIHAYPSTMPSATEPPM